MAVNVAQFIVAGAKQLQYGILDSNGLFNGNSASLSAGADGNPAGRIRGIKTADISIPEPEIVTITGDDIPMAQFIFPSASFPSFVIETATEDYDLNALAQGTLTQALGDWDIALYQPDKDEVPQMCLIFTSQAKSDESGSRGVKGFYNLIVPKAEIVPLGPGGFNERAEMTFRWQVNITRSDIKPWGAAISNADNGATGASMIGFYSEKPVTMHRWDEDTSTTVFTLGETANTGSNKIKAWENSVLETLSATTTSTITVDDGSGSFPLIALYEYVA